MNFPDKLLQLRQNSGLSQKDLAQALGVSQASVGYWEKGQRTPSIDAAQKISDYFKIPISELLGHNATQLADDIITLFANSPNLKLVSDSSENYKFDELLEIYVNNLGEFLYYNPEHKVLFDSSMEVKKEDVEFVRQMIDRINNSK